MNNTYVGNRYVPLHCGEWDSTKNTIYDALSVVYYQGNSYTSKQNVPKGIDITNSTFWVKSADYNAQLAIFSQDINDFKIATTLELDGKQIIDPYHYYVGVNQKFKTIKDAYNQNVADGKPNGIVLISAGVYDDFIQAEDNIRLTFIGEDKNNTIWKSSIGGYDNACITCGGGDYSVHLKNLTLIANHDSTPNYNFDTIGGAYAVHIDYPTGHGDFTIDDCVLMSYQNSALGCGTRTRQSIKLRNVELYHYADVATSGFTSVDNGCLLYHTAPESGHNIGQSFSMENVYAWSKNGCAIQILSSANNTGVADLTVINCTARSDFYEQYSGEQMEARVTFFNANGLIHLSEESRNNNSYKLNSTKNVSSAKNIAFKYFEKDLSVSGSQTINGAYDSNRVIDAIIFKANINGSSCISDGRYDVSFSDVYYNDNTNGQYVRDANFVVGLSKNGFADRAKASISSIANGNITLDWSKIGNGLNDYACITATIFYRTSK